MQNQQTFPCFFINVRDIWNVALKLTHLDLETQLHTQKKSFNVCLFLQQNLPAMLFLVVDTTQSWFNLFANIFYFSNQVLFSLRFVDGSSLVARVIQHFVVEIFCFWEIKEKLVSKVGSRDERGFTGQSRNTFTYCSPPQMWFAEWNLQDWKSRDPRSTHRHYWSNSRNMEVLEYNIRTQLQPAWGSLYNNK